MTPTIATIAVCAAAEILPAPIAALVIDTISTRMETKLDRVVAEVRRLKAERDAEIRSAREQMQAQLSYQTQQAASMAMLQMNAVTNQANLGSGYSVAQDLMGLVSGSPAGAKRRRPTPQENAQAAAYAAEEVRLAAQFNAAQESEHALFTEIARNDPHMRRA